MIHDQNKGQSDLSGAVKLWHLDGYAEADRLTYRETNRAVELFGNLFIQQEGLLMSANQGYLELDNDRGWLSDTEFRLTVANARGNAKKIDLIS
ncbi:MAG: hypothetical protein ABW158_17725, partial [Candidatus Thiodiazotropha sp. 6PDIVS]